MTCREVQEQAAGLASLAPGEAEREEAYRHAEGCPACAAALREGECVLALVDAAPALAAPSAAALARTAEAVRAEMRSPAWLRVFGWLLAPLLVAAAAIAAWVAGGTEFGAAEGVQCVAIELGGAVLALAAVGLAGRGARGAWGFSSVATVGAMAGELYLIWRCQANSTPHNLVFHFGGVLAAALLGAAFGGRRAARVGV